MRFTVNLSTLFVLILLVMPVLSQASDPEKSNDKPIVIAVFDSGLDISHPHIRSHLWNNPHEIPDNGRDENGDLHDDHEDSHGTQVTGIALGLHTGDEISENIKVMFFKYNMADPGSALLSALMYAEKQGVMIFHVGIAQPKETWKKTKSEIEKFTEDQRWGIIPWLESFYRTYNFIHSKEDFVKWYLQWQTDFSTRWEKAMEKIRELKNRMLIVAPVPNNNQNLNEVDFEPATLDSPNVISVMNLDSDYTPFKHSTYGSAYGNRKVTVGAVGVRDKSGFMKKIGASFAAPKITHTCATLALDLQREGMALTPQNIKKRLLDSLPESQDLKRYTITGKYLPEE